MYSISELLDMAKEKNPDLSSDRKLSIKLGVPNMHYYRCGRSTPSDLTASRLAELCGLPPEVVIAACHAAKAEDKKVKKAWKNIYKMAANMCLAVAVAWVLHFSQDAVMPAISTVSYVSGVGGMNIM